MTSSGLGVVTVTAPQQRAPGEALGVLGTIGRTPLIRLERLFPDVDLQLWAKIEGANPGGSSKDRAALAMIDTAIADGSLVPGHSTVIESSSGNLGVGLAQVCLVRGLRFVCVVDRLITVQNLALLRTYRAEVVHAQPPAGSSETDLEARLRTVRTLVAADPAAYWPNQYGNPANALGQRTMMSQLWDDLDGQIDHLFLPTGSCGTLRGCAEFLRDRGASTRITAVDAVGSVIFGGERGRRLIPGHGASVRPALFADGLATDLVRVDDIDAVVGCRHLVAREGILAGGSSGAVVSAVHRRLPSLEPGSRCAVILPDRGERYLDTIYDDTWVHENLGPRREDLPCW